MHGMLQPHPIDQLHGLLKPTWKNAAWIAAVGLIAGLAISVGLNVGIWLTHGLR